MAKKIQLFDFESVLKCDFFRLINPIYEFKDEKKQFEITNDSRRMFYGRCRFIGNTIFASKKNDPKDAFTINEAEFKSSPDYICLIVLSKRVCSPNDKLDIEFCERVNKVRSVDKFMDLNLLYFFDAAKVSKNKKPNDAMIPYEFLLDLS